MAAQSEGASGQVEIVDYVHDNSQRHGLRALCRHFRIDEFPGEYVFSLAVNVLEASSSDSVPTSKIRGRQRLIGQLHQETLASLRVIAWNIDDLLLHGAGRYGELMQSCHQYQWPYQPVGPWQLTAPIGACDASTYAVYHLEKVGACSPTDRRPPFTLPQLAVALLYDRTARERVGKVVYLNGQHCERKNNEWWL